MSPQPSIHNMRYNGTINWVYPRKFVLRYAKFMQPTYIKNFLFCKFGARITRTTRWPTTPSTFSFHVGTIVLRCASKDVVGVDTDTIVAGMTRLVAILNMTVLKIKRNTVSVISDSFATIYNRYDTIPNFAFFTFPYPAAIHRLNSFIKFFYQLRMHIAIIPQRSAVHQCN